MMNDEHDYITEDLQEFIDEFSKNLLQQSSKIQLPNNLNSQSLFEKYGIETENRVIEINKKHNFKGVFMKLLAYAACFMLIFVGYQQLDQSRTLTEGANLYESVLSSTAVHATPMQINGDVPSVASKRVEYMGAQFVEEYSQIRNSIVSAKLASSDYAQRPASSSKAASETPSQTIKPYSSVGNEDDILPSSPPPPSPIELPVALPQFKTNTQIVDIDEADIVKTDGEYIYHYRNIHNNGTVSIVRADNLKLTSSISVKDAQQVELYLQDNLLVVVESTSKDFAVSAHAQITSTLGDIAPITTTEPPRKGIAPSNSMSAMTKVSIYDVENKSAPKQVNTLAQDGDYISSRFVEDYLYVVSSKTTYDNVFKNSLSAATMIPVILKNSQAQLIKPEDIVISPSMQSIVYTVISSMNIKNNETQTKAVLGSDDMMMNHESLFITSNISNKATGEKGTGIVKFGINNGSLDYEAGTIVNGYIDNGFSLDEYNGNLRIATTTTKANNLYVLDEKLEQIGIIENLVPEEIIYSVRFLEDRGYIVTSKKVDPLFVIDLSNPKNLVVKGQLEIPAYSEYMHPIGDGKMIGVGVNAYEKSNFGLVEDGMKISLFDVTNDNPKELFNTIIGNSGTSSEMLSDHKAFMYYPEKKLLGFPVDIHTSSDPIYGNSSVTFQGYLLFEVKKDSFELKAKLSSATNDNNIGRFDSQIKINRAVYIGDNLYTVSNGRLVEYSLSTFTKTNELIYT